MLLLKTRSFFQPPYLVFLEELLYLLQSFTDLVFCILLGVAVEKIRCARSLRVCSVPWCRGWFLLALFSGRVFGTSKAGVLPWGWPALCTCTLAVQHLREVQKRGDLVSPHPLIPQGLWHFLGCGANPGGASMMAFTSDAETTDTGKIPSGQRFCRGWGREKAPVCSEQCINWCACWKIGLEWEESLQAAELAGSGLNLELPWHEGVEADRRKIPKSHDNFMLH